jgi:hypothetical protein
MRKDGRTDITNLIVAFRNVTNAPKIFFFFQFYNTNITNEGHDKWESTLISYLGSAGFVSRRGYRPLLQVFPGYYNQAMIKKSTIISKT